MSTNKTTRLCSYIMTTDCGFAPNPFWNYCTLAACTPNHRGFKIGFNNYDNWIAGFEEKYRGGKLIYAMNAEACISFDEYFSDPRFQIKKPHKSGSWKERCGTTSIL